MAANYLSLIVVAVLVVALIGGLVAGLVLLARRGDRRPAPVHPGPEAPRATPGCAVALGIGLAVGLLALAALSVTIYWSRSRTRVEVERREAYLQEVSSQTATVMETLEERQALEVRPAGESRREDPAATPPPPRELVVTSPPSADRSVPAGGDFPFVFRTPDYFEEWKRTFKGGFDVWALSARAEGRPAWVVDAGGSSYEYRDVPGKMSIWSRFPGPDGVLVGYSPDLEPTHEDARRAALRSAVEQLKAVLLWELRDRPGERGDSIFLEAAELAEHILYEEQEKLITEEVASEARLRAGTVHRHAVRVRADEPTVRRLTQRLDRGLATNELARIQGQRKLVTDVLSALGLALCVFLIYCFLNAGTKGHFAWPLRIVSAAVFIIIFLLALA